MKSDVRRFITLLGVKRSDPTIDDSLLEEASNKITKYLISTGLKQINSNSIASRKPFSFAHEGNDNPDDDIAHIWYIKGDKESQTIIVTLLRKLNPITKGLFWIVAQGYKQYRVKKTDDLPDLLRAIIPKKPLLKKFTDTVGLTAINKSIIRKRNVSS